MLYGAYTIGPHIGVSLARLSAGAGSIVLVRPIGQYLVTYYT